jgi:hypothetical protein
MQKKKLRIVVGPKVAEILKAQKNKSAYIEEAVLWYARFGEECLQKLDQIIRLLSSGSLPPLGVATVEKREDIEDAFAGFEV